MTSKSPTGKTDRLHSLSTMTNSIQKARNQNARNQKFWPSGLLTSGLLSGAAAGGAERDRTVDLLLAKQALSQLSYTPVQMTDIRVQMSDTAPGIDRQRSIVHAASLISDI